VKRWVGFVGLLVALSLMVGCATENYNPYLLPGAGIGGALGAGIGAAANHSNPWRGAAIGGLLGGAAGAVGGELYGRYQPYPYPQRPQASNPQQPQAYYQQQAPGYYQQQPQGYYQADPNGNYQ